MEGVYSMGELTAKIEAEERPFWTCPVTGRDCRFEPKPALAIIRENRQPVRFQMYATWDLAGDASARVMECESGMSSDFILDHWLHWGAKTWMDQAAFAAIMRRVAWHFGNRSWAMCPGSGNPRIIGTHARA